MFLIGLIIWVLISKIAFDVLATSSQLFLCLGIFVIGEVTALAVAITAGFLVSLGELVLNSELFS